MGSSHLIKHRNGRLSQSLSWTVIIWVALLLNKRAQANDADALDQENRVEVDGAFIRLAHQLQRRGVAAIIFDYRHWGASGGQPRHVVNPASQVEDLRAVVNHVIDTGGCDGVVDPLHIHLVGLSLGGGHVLTLAAEIGRDNNEKLLRSVRTVTALAPYLHSKVAKKQIFGGYLIRILRLVLVIFADLIAAAFGRPPVYIDCIGPSGGSRLSALQVTGDDFKLWQEMKGNSTPTQLAARSLHYLKGYSPLDNVAHIRKPTLFIIGENDTVAPADLTEEAATRINATCAGRPHLAETINLPTSHFGFIKQPTIEQVVDKILAFTAKWDGQHGQGSESSFQDEQLHAA